MWVSLVQIGDFLFLVSLCRLDFLFLLLLFLFLAFAVLGVCAGGFVSVGVVIGVDIEGFAGFVSVGVVIGVDIEGFAPMHGIAVCVVCGFGFRFCLRFVGLCFGFLCC